MIQVTQDPYAKLIRTLLHRKIRDVGVEAGHIYADQQPGTEQAIAFDVAAELCQRLSNVGITPCRVVFIDDYNADKTDFCIDGYVDFAGRRDFCPDNVFWESHMVEPAETVIEQLSAAGQVEPNGGEGLITSKHRIKLRHDDGRLTCAVLDAAFHQHRFERFGYTITVLPTFSDRFPDHDYKQQQRNVRRIFRLLGQDELPLGNVFFDQQGSFNVVLH